MTHTHLIFDLDGTLINPKFAITRSFNYGLVQHGYPEMTEEWLRPFIGRHLIEAYTAATGEKDEKKLWEMIYSYRERYETVGIKENILYDGVRELFAKLNTKNYIASIKPHFASRLILKELGLDKYFAGVYGSEKDGTRADKMEILPHLKLSENIEHAVMVGDRDVDMQAAKHCGFYAIGVAYGFGGREELVAAGADVVVEDVEELIGALSQ